MTKPNIALNFRRRVYGMLSTLFRRRWNASLQAARRSRLARRFRELADGFADAASGTMAAAGKLTNTHLLTLAQPEFLERRAVMDVGVGMIDPTSGSAGTTLAVWIDASGADQDAYVRQATDGTIQVANSPTFSFASVGAVQGQTTTSGWNGVTSIQVFRSTGLVGVTNLVPGAGFTTTSNLSVTVNRGTYANFISGQAAATATLTPTAFSFPTADNTGTHSNGTYWITQVSGGPSGANRAMVQATTTNGNITALTLVQPGVGYTNLAATNLQLTGTGGPGGGTGGGGNSGGFIFAATGGIASVTFTNAGRGYVNNLTTGVVSAGASSLITFSGGGGSGASANGVLDSNVTGTNGSTFTVVTSGAGVSALLTPALNIGVVSPSPTTLNLGGLGGAVQIGNPNVDINGTTVSGSQNGVPQANSLNTTVLATGFSTSTFPQSVNFQGNISTSGSVQAFALNSIVATGTISTGALRLETGRNSGASTLVGDINLSGGTLRATSLLASANKGNVTIAGATNVTGSMTVLAQRGGNISFAASVDTGNISAHADQCVTFATTLNSTNSGGIQLQSDAANVNLFGTVTASGNGSLLITVPGGTGMLTSLGSIDATNGALYIQEGSAAPNYTLNTNVTTFGGSLASNLTLVNGKSLTVSNVSTSAAALTIQAQNDLTVTADISATAAAGTNVSLTSTGNLTVNGTISAQNNAIHLTSTNGSVRAGAYLSTGNDSAALVDVAAATGIDLGNNVQSAFLTANTTNGSINAGGVGVASFTIVRAVAAGTGNITLQSGPNLVVAGNVTAANGNITLRSTGANVVVTNTAFINSAVGNIAIVADATGNDVILNGTISTLQSRTVSLSANNGVAGQIIDDGVVISTGTINFTASSQNSSLLSGVNATYGTLSARITGANNPLNVTRSQSLNLSGVSTTNGAISVSVDNAIVPATIGVTGAVSAGSLQNVTLSAVNGSVGGVGLITANVVDVTAQNSSTIATNVTTLVANVTGANQTLGVTESTSVNIGSVATNNGDIQIAATAGNIGGIGSVAAGTANITLRAATGNVTLNNIAGQVVGNVLDVTAQNSSAINTNVTSLLANITGANHSLTVSETDGLLVGTDIRTNNGDVFITLAAGNLAGNGSILAGTGNVVLDASQGAVTLNAAANQVAGNVLTLTSKLDAAVNTAASSLAANVTSGSLTVIEADDLAIAAANVVAATDVSLALLTGNLTRTGTINASTGNVTLTVANGTILGIGSVVSSNVLSWTSLNQPQETGLSYTGLSANVTGAGNTLDLSAAGAPRNVINAVTDSGDITFNNAGAVLTISGSVIAGQNVVGFNNVTINATNVTMPAGGITANVADVTTSSSTQLRTNVTTLVANVTGAGSNLNVVQSSSLSIGSDVTAAGNIAIQLTAGNLTGTGNIVAGSGAGNVSLNAVTGGINLTSAAGQVRGNVVTVASFDNAAVNSNATTLIASITGAGKSLTVTEANSLLEAGTNITTNNGDVSLTLTTGSLTGNGNIIAGTGTVTLNAIQGGITLNSFPGQISGNVLDVSAQNSTAVNTNVNTLIANITGNGSTLVVNELNSLLAVGTNVATNNGDISINLVNGSLSGTGNIVAGTGNISLNASQGGITLNTTTGQITGNVLSVSANSASTLHTDVNNFAAAIANGNLTVVETAGLSVDPANITASGDISIRLASGDLNRVGEIRTPGKITLNVAGSITGTGLISASGFDWTAQDQLDNTNISYNNLWANITGVGNDMVIDAPFDFTLESALTNSGNITFNVANGAAPANLTINGSVKAGTAGGKDVTLNVPLGYVNTFVGGLITANQVTTAADTASVLRTNSASLVANITGSGESLTIYESRSSTAVGADIVTNDGDILIEMLAGNLTGTGNVAAGLGTVTLTSANGAILLDGTASSGSTLFVNARDNSSVNTSVELLAANMSGSGQSLTINEANGLGIDAAGVTTLNGDLSITLAAGDLGGAGLIATGAGNIVLNAVTGGIDLTAAEGQVSGNTLTLGAQNAAAVSTNVTTLVANITGSGNMLTVTETANLAIGTDVRTSDGDISINVLAGDLTGTGNINAGLGNVSLTVNDQAGAVVNLPAANQITANGLQVLGGSVNIGTNVDRLTVGANSFASIRQSKDLLVVTGLYGGIVAYGDGAPVTVNLASGNLTIDADAQITAGGQGGALGNVTLQTLGGGINQVSATDAGVVANLLTLDVQNSSWLSGSVVSIEGTVRGASQNLTYVDIDSIDGDLPADGLTVTNSGITGNGGLINLVVTEGNLALNGTILSRNGDISLNAANGSIGGVGNVTAGTANVTLNASQGAVTLIASPGQISGNILALTAQNSSAINTNVNTLIAKITGANQTLTVNELTNLLEAGANIATNNGDISINLVNGSLYGNGNIVAGTANVTLNASNGGITLNSFPGQISGNVLNVTANSSTSLNTNINTLIAKITGASQTLTVNELNTLLEAGTNIATNNGDISITLFNGSLTGNGNILAGTGNIVLNASNGGITLNNFPGQISGNVLNVTAKNSTAINTNVNTLIANITGAGNTLVVNELNTLLAVGTNVATNNGDITLNLVNGSLTGTGNIIAGSANVSLNAPNGGITLNTSASQITGNVLTIRALNSTAISSNVSTLVANVTGNGQSLTVNEASSLLQAGTNIATNNGAITITLATGSLTGNGNIIAGSGNVTINASNGGITLNNFPGQISGNVLNVSARNNTAINTNVNTLIANVSGAGNTLVVNELNALLAVGTNVATNNGDISINLVNGSMTGTGNIIAGSANITLNAPNGGITLNTSASQIRGNVLNITAQNSTSVTTNITTLNANVVNTTASLTVTEANGLVIGSVRSGGGPITISAGQVGGGTINGGTINAGGGNVTLTNANGSITLASVANQITGNVLTMSATNGIAANTSVNNLNATVTSTGNITVVEANNLTVDGAKTANGFVNISTTSASTLTVGSINAATGANGNVFLTAGNVIVNAPGIRATGTVNLAGVSNSININAGGTIVSNATILNTTGPANTVNWNVSTPAATGPGSLNDVLTNVNQFNNSSTITIANGSNYVVNLTQALPAITKPLTLIGNNNLTINGAGLTSGSGLVLTGNGISVSGVTLRNFRATGAAGIDVNGSRNSNVANVVVSNSSIGLQARGVLTGTRIGGSTFQNNNQGVFITGASNLTFGVGGSSQFNTISNSTTFGLTITGVNGGTRIMGNRFSYNPTAISLVGATGASATNRLLIGNSTSPNNISYANVGVVATGFCTYTTISNMAFGAGVKTQYNVVNSRNLTLVR